MDEVQNVDCGLGLKQNTTKLGVYWPDKDFKKKALGPLTPCLLRTQSVQLRVRTSTRLEKVRVEIYLKTISYSTSLTLEGMEKLLWGEKGNIFGINFNSSYIFKSSDC